MTASSGRSSRPTPISIRPKTLEELQKPPTKNALGYEGHHNVEQNDDNVAKTVFEKFGRSAIDDPSNIVYIPRLKHEQITADFNITVDADPQKRTLREIVGEMDFNQQRDFGYKILRKYGILQ